MKKEKVAIAMSGGVDSGVAAGILVKQGYKCAGFHMRLWHEPQLHLRGVPQAQHHLGGVRATFQNKCCSTESLEAARRTCHKLGIPFYLVDFSGIFKKKVVDYFLEEYGEGRTPNPCVMCNKYIKFGELLDYVRKLGFDFLATGHYARISPRRSHGFTGVQPATVRGVSGFRLLMARDKTKDQSYFLYNLTQKQLAHILFPVGDHTKRKVRELAKAWDLPVAERPESQDICFFPEVDHQPFLLRQIGKKIKPGEVVDVEGNVMGRHKGIALYTVGQRHGLEINSKFKNQKSKLIPPYYVVAKDAKRNRLIVGFGKETERKEFEVKEVNLINKIPNLRCMVKIRYQGETLEAAVRMVDSRAKVILDEPVRGIAPGQAAVFYRKEEVLGGGIIV